ncbi:MAG: YdiU family protein [Defluviitaleaceae bacterium]|nr:YdiU family protein [Defluviitaleaceae bacterium]
MSWNLENTYAELPEIFYRKQNPEIAPAPKLLIFNEELAAELGLEENSAEIFAGSKLPPGSKPISQAYAGYQFGHFAMLGDGRAVLLGEQITPGGERFDIQLKGSGRTAFSRNGDGYAALLPMLREYIISEAMFYLGIPTTRSLAVVLTGEDVVREKILPGAVLTRVASSHIRVGTFNYIAGAAEETRILADYTIRRHFPETDKYVLFLREVAKRQADLIAKWQCVGFIHGVMNTDNMAISGETIDYGPCAFMDSYDPSAVFSSIDIEGRYAYENQPKIGAWNLLRFAESILPLLHENENEAVEIAKAEIENYWQNYKIFWQNEMRNKLGIEDEGAADAELFAEMLDLMAAHKLDYTNTFRAFPAVPEPLAEWQKKWQARFTCQPKKNPAVIPRNYRVEEALSAADNGDFSVMHKLLAVLRKPYENSDEYSKPPPENFCNYKTFCGT